MVTVRTVDSSAGSGRAARPTNGPPESPDQLAPAARRTTSHRFPLIVARVWLGLDRRASMLVCGLLLFSAIDFLVDAAVRLRSSYGCARQPGLGPDRHQLSVWFRLFQLRVAGLGPVHPDLGDAPAAAGAGGVLRRRARRAGLLLGSPTI